jgi:hypothetical protein
MQTAGVMVVQRNHQPVHKNSTNFCELQENPMRIGDE